MAERDFHHEPSLQINQIMNILTFDVEEWFHLLDFDATCTEADWGKYEVRIHENVERIFRILDDTNTKATFL